MGNTDFAGLYLNSFIFGVVFSATYDLLWVIRVSFFGKRQVWLTDFIATSLIGVFISVLQYNFSSGKFRVLPFVIFPLGVFFARATFSRVLRVIINKIIDIISDFCFCLKIRVLSHLFKKKVLRNAKCGFLLLKIFKKTSNQGLFNL